MRVVPSLVQLVLCLVAMRMVLAASSKRPFRSIHAPKETIEKYEIVSPIVTYSDGEQPHPRELHISLETQAVEYQIILIKNEMLIPSQFKSISYDEQGNEVVDKGHVNCFYQGRVEGHSDWVVTMSTCHGLRGSFGVSTKKESMFHLEPLNAEDNSLNQFHAFYLETEYKTEEGSCACNESYVVDDLHGMEMPSIEDLEKDGRLKRQTNGFWFLELIVINDFRQYDAYNRNLKATIMRALEVANEVDRLYSPLNIHVILIECITWTSGDMISVVSHPTILLSNLYDYHPQVTTPYDSLMLFTGIDLNGTTLGVAYVKTMCTRQAVSLIQEGGQTLAYAGVLAAHELGHNLNMKHDDKDCTCPIRRCIMSSKLKRGQDSSTWSSCSADYLNEGFHTYNLNRCLGNTPTMTVGDPVCGNGIKETSEACDCGTPSECIDPCCNANTCQLASGAECSAGPCCTSQCQFVAAGTTCRDDTGSCDILEFCSGDSGQCPNDEHLLDGSSCTSSGVSGYCSSGKCPTYNAQCQTAFGSLKGVMECYDSNDRGDNFGNCGAQSGSYVPCTTANIQCGLLHCQQGDFDLMLGFRVSIGTLRVFVPTQDSIVTCMSYTLPPDSDAVNPGLVEQGTKCSDGRACVNQACVPSSQLTPFTCPTGGNGQPCSGNGVCNNNGGCSCNSGFSGSTCQNTGDISECAANNGGCGQICSDTVGSFSCSCNTGFSLDTDQRTCIAINECQDGTNNCAQFCTDTGTSFICSCGNGFSLNANGADCNDINECTANNGGCSQQCVNSVGSFSCACSPGYTVGANGSCDDTNECASDTGGCNHTCVNSEGSFYCACDVGYISSNNGLTCTNVDECLLSNGGCYQGCSDTTGSYVCTCNPGFSLGSDGKSCTPINECANGSNNCDQFCTDTDSSFVCSCRSGFTLNSDQATCTDIDECQGSAGFICEQVCINTLEITSHDQFEDKISVGPIVSGVVTAILLLIILGIIVVLVIIKKKISSKNIISSKITSSSVPLYQPQSRTSSTSNLLTVVNTDSKEPTVSMFVNSDHPSPLVSLLPSYAQTNMGYQAPSAPQRNFLHLHDPDFAGHQIKTNCSSKSCQATFTPKLMVFAQPAPLEEN